MKHHTSRLLLAAATFVAASSASSASAATAQVWQGDAGGTDLNSAANWVSGSAPVAGDSFQFGATNNSPSTTLTNTLAANFNVNGITFDADAPAYTLGGNALTVSTGITSNFVGTQTITAGVTTSGNTALTTVSGGTLSLANLQIGSTTTTLSGAGTVTISNNNTGLKSNAGGNLIVGNGSTLSLGSSSYSNNFFGTLTVNTGGVVNNSISTASYAGFGAGSVIALNGGTFNYSGTMATNSGYTLNFTSTSTGTVNFTGASLAGTGTVKIGTGVTANFANSNVAQELTLADGAIVNFTGQATWGGSNISVTSGTATVQIGTASGGGLNGSAALSVKNGVIMTIASGTYMNNYTGAITVDAGGILNHNSNGNGYAGFGAGATLSVSGAYVASSGSGLQNLAALTINEGGSVQLSGAASLAANAIFTNNGTFKLGNTSAKITLSGTGGYTLNGTLDLNNLFNTATDGSTYTLISGGTGDRNDTAVTIIGFNKEGMQALFSDGVLTFSAVPEPSTYGLLGAGALAAAALVCHRRKVSGKAA